VIAAANGEDALRQIDTHPHAASIQLVVSDVVMPGMGGRELVYALSRRNLDIPVVFMSGYTNDDKPLEDMLGRRAAFLPKPFTAQDLARLVRRTLDVNASSSLGS
jgi:DNA-binding NtrC family response regulator